MSKKKNGLSIGTEDIRWDLTFLYAGIADPQIDIDVKRWIESAKKFHADHKGNLHETLGKALLDYTEMSKITDKVFHYISYRLTLDTDDNPVKVKKAEVERDILLASGTYLEFVNIEIAAIDESVLQKLYESDPVVLRHKPYVEDIRKFKKHMLTEEVESALTKRAQFGPGSWDEYYDEIQSDLRFTYNGEELNEEELFHMLGESKEARERAEIQKILNEGLKKNFAKLAAKTLNMIVGSKEVEDRERGYVHPMESRNKGSHIPDRVVEALHKAVLEVGAPLARRYYKLKAAHLGMEKLRWSDRNAPMPFSDTTSIPWDKALAMVLEAYESFSPTLAQINRKFVEQKRIDALVTQKKRGGAYSSSGYIESGPYAMTMLNYLGSARDVATLAHELGHSVHGILAGEAQGPLMMDPPMAYCETASVFGEMVTFEYLKREVAKKGNEALVALVMKKLDDVINTVVRQIAFSNFERRIHAMDSVNMKRGDTKHLSVADLCRHWLESRAEYYGADGDVFVYGDDEYLWAYVPHFHDPFYVYAYAFGELLTHSLYALKDDFGDRFEGLYLDLLRSGDTKDVVELLKPFGLDPTNPQFWVNGLNVSIGTMLKEAEELSKKMGVEVK